MRRFEASRERFTNRGKRRGATILRFRLSRAARLVLVVRGPGPSCEVAARIPVRGRAGANRYRFTGRVDGRPLEPGTYLLTPRLRGSTRDLAREHVTIDEPGPAVTPRVLPDCDDDRHDAGTTFLTAADEYASSGLVVLGAFAPPPQPDASATSPPPVGDVRGEAVPEAAGLPLPTVSAGDDELPPVLGVVLLALLAGSLIGVAVAVVHYVRSA